MRLKTIIYIMVLVAFAMGQQAKADNTLSMSDVTCTRGGETQIVVPVAMNNDDEITAIQCDIALPSIATMAENSGVYDIWLDETRKASNHNLSATASSGGFRIVISSPTGKAFKGNSGNVFYFRINVNTLATTGIYIMKLSNIVLSTVSGARITPDNVNATLTLQCLRGDANNDGAVNVADYDATRRYLSRLSVPGDFYADAADCNEDGTVDAADLVCIVLKSKGIAPSTAATGSNVMTLSDINLLRGQGTVTDEIPVLLSNSDAISAIQFDLSIPSAVAIKMNNDNYDVWLERKSSDHIITTQLSSDEYRIVVSSPSAASIGGNSGAVLKFNANVNTSTVFTRSMTLTNVVLSTTGGQRIKLGDISADVIVRFIIGDANSDYTVDVADYVMACNAILNKPQISTFYLDAADVDGDGVMTVIDLVKILRISLGLD